jgi:peptidoglycan/xylan/chitin deacetylase (PgdA/CDA1 family)
MLSGIPNKREYLARALGRFGLLGLLERVAAARPGLVVLTYHRIAEPGTDSFYDPVISATPEGFRAHMEWLHNHRRVLAFDELLAQVQSGLPWHQPAVLLTFDDGYRDNFDIAAPILRERNLPATFFIPTAFLESPRLPWWDHVAYVIKQTNTRQLTMKRDRHGHAAPLAIDLQTMSRDAAIMTVIQAFLDETIADERWFLDHLAHCAEVDVDSEGLGRELFMNWDQVRQLANSGTSLTIGSHAYTHRKLAGLDADSQRHELASSKQLLEARLGRQVTGLAYPYGWPGSYTNLTKVLAIEAGYRLAFSSQEGINRFTKFDAYEVRRLGIGSADSAALLRARAALHVMFGRSLL